MRFERIFLQRARQHAQELVASANDPGCEEGVLVRRYLDAWISSVYDLREIPEMLRELNKSLQHWRLVLFPTGIDELNEPSPILRLGTKVFIPSGTLVKTGGEPVSTHVLTGDAIDDPANRIALSFHELVLGPCARNILRCDHCGRFHLNVSGHRNKRYCSRNCALASSVKKQRAKVQKRKLRRALKAYHRFKELRPKGKPWKEWVARNAKVSTWWLTRAINSRRLPRSPDELIAHPESKK